MKRLHLIGIVVFLLIGLLTWGIGPVLAQGEANEKIDKPLSPLEGNDVHSIPIGSTVYHLPTGITKVYGPDKELVLTARDNEASLVTTPFGPQRATHVFEVPNGSLIDESSGDEITRIYKDDVRVLTVVNKDPASKVPAPAMGDRWIEWAEDESVSELEYFVADWEVPADPQSPGENTIVYLFNGIEPDEGGKIIQPVLEWNSGNWFGRSWYVWGDGPNDYYRSPYINVDGDDEVRGTMEYGEVYANYWYVEFYNIDEAESTGFYTNAISNEDLMVYVTLEEGQYVNGDEDITGDTTFHNMSLLDGSESSVTINWAPQVDPLSHYTFLSHLNVSYSGQSTVYLYTDN